MNQFSSRQQFEGTENTRRKLQQALANLKVTIGHIGIGSKEHFPYGWRKAAKGRTVWRIVEEVINQNLEKKHQDFEIIKFSPAASEVEVFDFVIQLNGDLEEVYVNIKSSVVGAKSSKDDISKAAGLLDFYLRNPEKQLFIATFELRFIEEPFGIEIADVSVMPTAWLPDIYVNPSNNGNLQSAHYKNLSTAVKRTNLDFVEQLNIAVAVANQKKANKK